jgi:hypothetical protein
MYKLFGHEEDAQEVTDTYRAAVRTFVLRLCPEGVPGCVMRDKALLDAWHAAVRIKGDTESPLQRPEEIAAEQALREAGLLRAKLWSGSLTHLEVAADPSMPLAP